MIQKVEQILKDLIIGKIPVKLNLNEPDRFENGQTFKEDIVIELPDDDCIWCEFDWSYIRKKGQKSSDRLTPDDSDKLILDYLNIKTCIFSPKDEEMSLDVPSEEVDINKNPELKSLMKTFLMGELPVDIDYKKENRLLKFEEFVNEKKELKYTKKDVYKKGDEIAYRTYFPPSGMLDSSKGEYSKTIDTGVIEKRTKKGSGYEYKLKYGHTVRPGEILGVIE